jgi:hypothetical protein
MRILLAQSKYSEVWECGSPLEKAQSLYSPPLGLGHYLHLAKLGDRLANIRRGIEFPIDAAEAMNFAELCYLRSYFQDAARLSMYAFATEPQLANDSTKEYRYSAACMTVLAGYSHGESDTPTNNKEFAEWRTKALDWLRLDLSIQRHHLALPPQRH